ncbi:DNA polymerase III subunit epsilon [Marinivivus vitaminiproducens]|uniref:DNA polymerase III subunit epsilon n=1 Tax=Marinivivus vitaminiproducens TaxID=3035935 RepID=UPI0027A1C29C|nr:DNA polymerase III subunit epsilon [Geminicoccaceae bacterium SCSIO 64248]
MREIVFDTETTGLSPLAGDRVVEIGCVELINHVPTGRSFHAYINPERSMPEEAFRIHGLSEAFLADKPVFAEIAPQFRAFVDQAADGSDDPARLVAHNGTFDMAFLNAEFARQKMQRLGDDRLVDTLILARTKFPGAPASLDALCRRFGVDTAARVKHGALLDSELLAEVYLYLIGGRQPDLALGVAAGSARTDVPAGDPQAPARPVRPARPHAPSARELAAWQAFVGTLSQPLWLDEAADGPAS